MKSLDKLNNNDFINKIKGLKKELGSNLVIPAHHYQRQGIVELADFIGDSYKLAVKCNKTSAEFIVFCGVLFMAEGANILAQKNQKILIPEPRAGCPMADMANITLVKKAYDKISNICKNDIAPVVYINSYADLKSFCGKHGGAVCTSSNAIKILKYYFGQNKSVLFFPDYYLGKNTANLMCISKNEIVKIKKDMSFEEGNPEKGKIFLWDGFCSVHQKFKASDIDFLRNRYKDIKIIVHPECREEVVNNSDISGSTEKISKMIAESPSGSKWGVGTETTFVDRLAKTFPDKTIVSLRNSVCINMTKITLENLYLSIKSISDYLINKSKLRYQIEVNNEYKKDAKKALEKMIEIVEK